MKVPCEFISTNKYHCYKTNPTEIVKGHTLQRRILKVYKPPTTPLLKTCSSL